jgi:hypothetical protein
MYPFKMNSEGKAMLVLIYVFFFSFFNDCNAYLETNEFCTMGLILLHGSQTHNLCLGLPSFC